MFILFIYIYFISSLNCFLSRKEEKIIISLISDPENIYNTFMVINSIINQNVKKDLYNIIVILSFYEYSSMEDLPLDVHAYRKSGNIKFIFTKNKISDLSRTLITMRYFKNNPIILINNKCLLPDGWLEMLINDHLKYPNDAIAASIEFFYSKDGEIKEFKEGFNGEKYGIFNHISEMVFNFAIFNIDLGGVLYPKNYFKKILFYDENLFIKTSNGSEDFWHSAFIMIEDNILRQSSKIFDYTKYLLNDINYNDFNRNKIILLSQKKLLFMRDFPNFENTIQKRQKKIIVSITSYPKRFIFLPDLMTFIRNQDFHINKIIFFFYKEDIKYYSLKIKDVQIILIDKNLRPHLKYFYAMKLFRDYAIITLDDDIGYANNTFRSLFNAYIQNPNVICGRRSHLMTYKNNGELKEYSKWVYEQKYINYTNFDLVLTNVGGTIFPPDILNINDDYIPIIKDTITCGDLTLKYFANLKGIPQKWIFNGKINGISRKLPKTNALPLFQINSINNDICINKLNIIINKTILKNLCVNYRSIPTGNSIYLFDIHRKMVINNILYFEIYAYSYCPIDTQITFNIYFENNYANCFFNESNKFFSNKKYNSGYQTIAFCYINNTDNDLDFYFPSAFSKDNIFINMFNYRKYLFNIFKDFFCQTDNNCILETILLAEINYYNFSIIINGKQYRCNIDIKDFYLINDFPSIKKFKCIGENHFFNISKNLISGVPSNYNIKNEISDHNKIYKQFIISRIANENKNGKRLTIIIGKLVHNLYKESYNFTINVLYPEIVLKCNLKPNSKYVQSKIYCNNEYEFNSEILIENQIVNLFSAVEALLLINEETYIKIKFNHNYQKVVSKKDYQKEINIIYYINFVFILLFILLVCKRRLFRNIFWIFIKKIYS